MSDQGHSRFPTLSRARRHVAHGLTFDGVHVGHREVIDSADTVLTFDRHPLRVIRPRGGAPN